MVLRPEHFDSRPLTELAERFPVTVLGDIAGLEVTGISLAADSVCRGDLYVALQGAHTHGAEFVAEARERGAAAVLTDEAGADRVRAGGLPALVTDSPRGLLGAISAWVYRTADAPLRVFGVTGTNGKTSTAYLLDAIARQLGHRTGLSTTAARVIDGQRSASRLTTPEAPEVHAMLALLVERGIDLATLEVSAQAITRHRVDGVVFDVTGFTNLSHDHLDDYGTMDAYLAAKAELFTTARTRHAVVSLDSPYGEQVVARAEVPVTTITSRADVRADWRVEIVDQTEDHTAFVLIGPHDERIRAAVPLVGVHMAANAALAIVMLLCAGHSVADIQLALGDEPIMVYLPGRAERVSGPTGPRVYVDFGHSADAYATTLAALRPLTPGRLIVLCAANGNRDATKRHDMGRVAAEGSDVVIVTDHHPRLEDPATIRAALLEGAEAAQSPAQVLEVVPPEQAIRTAIAMARPGDTVLWAGPGHLDYRDVAGVKVPFDARALAREALRDAGWQP